MASCSLPLYYKGVFNTQETGTIDRICPWEDFVTEQPLYYRVMLPLHDLNQNDVSSVPNASCSNSLKQKMLPSAGMAPPSVNTIVFKQRKQNLANGMGGKPSAQQQPGGGVAGVNNNNNPSTMSRKVRASPLCTVSNSAAATQQTVRKARERPNDPGHGNDNEDELLDNDGEESDGTAHSTTLAAAARNRNRKSEEHARSSDGEGGGGGGSEEDVDDDEAGHRDGGQASASAAASMRGLDHHHLYPVETEIEEEGRVVFPALFGAMDNSTESSSLVSAVDAAAASILPGQSSITSTERRYFRPGSRGVKASPSPLFSSGDGGDDAMANRSGGTVADNGTRAFLRSYSPPVVQHLILPVLHQQQQQQHNGWGQGNTSKLQQDGMNIGGATALTAVNSLVLQGQATTSKQPHPQQQQKNASSEGYVVFSSTPLSNNNLQNNVAKTITGTSSSNLDKNYVISGRANSVSRLDARVDSAKRRSCSKGTTDLVNS